MTDGLADTDYIAFPDAELCKPGAPTSRTPVVSEPEEGDMDAAMDADMDTSMEEATPMEGMIEKIDSGEISQEEIEAAANQLADGEVRTEDIENALEGEVG